VGGGGARELRHRVQALGGPVRGGVGASQGVAGGERRAQAVEQLQPREASEGGGGGRVTLVNPRLLCFPKTDEGAENEQQRKTCSRDEDASSSMARIFTGCLSPEAAPSFSAPSAPSQAVSRPEAVSRPWPAQSHSTPINTLGQLNPKRAINEGMIYCGRPDPLYVKRITYSQTANYLNGSPGHISDHSRARLISRVTLSGHPAESFRPSADSDSGSKQLRHSSL
jgi:hypothetical protein